MECQLENITIHYEVFGEGQPILMLHGWPLDHHHMVTDMEPIFHRRNGWKRIYPDLPGMGKTQAPSWLTTHDQVLEIMLDFIDHVIPGERFTVAGMSYGGFLGRGLLHRRQHSLDGLMLVVPRILYETSVDRLPAHTCLVHDPALLADLEPEDAQHFQEFAVVECKALLEVVTADIFPAIARADRAFLSRFNRKEGFSFNVDRIEEPFGAPTLILTGRQDSDCGYRDAWDLLENFPRATFAVLDRAGHGLSAEQPALFRALVSEWLDRVEEFARSQDRGRLEYAAGH